MTSFPRRAVSWLRIIAVVALLVTSVSLIPPAIPVQAQSGLYPGAVGLVANSGAEPVLLRETPSFEAAVLTTVPAGAAADIVEGPVTGDDGTPWYGVSYGGLFGYIVAGYLVDSGQWPRPSSHVGSRVRRVGAEAVPVEWTPEAARSQPSLQQQSRGHTSRTIATADVYLRAEPSFSAMAMMVIPAGAAVTPTGEWLDQFAGVTTRDSTAGSKATGWAKPRPKKRARAGDRPGARSRCGSNRQRAHRRFRHGAEGGTAFAMDVVNLRADPLKETRCCACCRRGRGDGHRGHQRLDAGLVQRHSRLHQCRSAQLRPAPVSLAQEALLEAAPAVSGESSGLTATTLSDVNLRGGPDIAAPVIGAIPPGVAMAALAGPSRGSPGCLRRADRLGLRRVPAGLDRSFQRGNQEKRQDAGKVEGLGAARNAELGGGIVWPVSGGTWHIMQGYHGSSHQNGAGSGSTSTRSIWRASMATPPGSR